MKIVAGDFGNKGGAFISKDRKLVIEGLIRQVYEGNHILKISTKIESEKKLGFFRFLILLLILGVIFGAILNILGIVIALILATVFAFYKDEKNILTVDFNDNKSVSLECTNWGVKRIFEFKEKNK